jgi:hypothetical protein
LKLSEFLFDTFYIETNLDEKCKKFEETIQRVATNTIGYTKKQANKEWFDEECAEVNEENNATKERAIKIKIFGQECLQTSPDKKDAFVQKKARQLDEEAIIEIGDIGVFRILVNFTSADRSNHKRLWFEPKTINQQTEMERTY